MQATRNRLLSDDPTTCELVRIFSVATTDVELQKLVAWLNVEAKNFHGSEFHLAFVSNVISRDFRKRILLKIIN